MNIIAATSQKDPLMVLEQKTPDIIPLEKILRETATLTGNVQEQPYYADKEFACCKCTMENTFQDGTGCNIGVAKFIKGR